MVYMDIKNSYYKYLLPIILAAVTGWIFELDAEWPEASPPPPTYPKNRQATNPNT